VYEEDADCGDKTDDWGDIAWAEEAEDDAVENSRFFTDEVKVGLGTVSGDDNEEADLIPRFEVHLDRDKTPSTRCA
jgi:hypothetical protein